MSKKIPFLEMFAALTQWAEFVNAMEGWVITEASIDRSSRSAVVTVEGAAGAGPTWSSRRRRQWPGVMD